MVISAVFCVILSYYGLIRLACYIAAITFGLGIAPMYPLIFAIPSEFNSHLNHHQITNITTFALLAEGTLTAFTGKLMEWIHPNLLFYSFIVLPICMWIARYFSVLLSAYEEKA